MPKKQFTKLSDKDLVSLIYGEKDKLTANSYDELEDQRKDSHNAYVHTFTEITTPTTGMSSVLFNFTNPCVDTLTTYMTKIFCSDKETVVYNPNEQVHKPMASQLTKMVNKVIHQHNNGYYVLNRHFKDTALNKNGIVKITWQEEPLSFTKNYDGSMTEEELDAILFDYESKGFECEVKVDEDDDYVISCSRMSGKPVIENIPPEEFLINDGAIDINDMHKTKFVAHRQLRFVSDILAMFPKVKLDELGGEDSELAFEDETQERSQHDGTYETFGITDGGHKQTSRRELLECWVRADRDGDGYAELLHCFLVGHQLLMMEEWDGPIPFASFSFFPDPHKFYGLSVYDKVRRYETAATGLLRSGVDMANQQSTFRILADPRFVDERNLQSGRPGIIPVKPGFDPKYVMPLPTPPGAGNTTDAMIQRISSMVAAEIGIDPITGQISLDAQKSGNDATKTGMVIDNASAKVESYAREYADTALRDIVYQIANLLVMYQTDPFVKDLADSCRPDELMGNMPTGDFPFLAAETDMDDFVNRANITPKVGLGHLTGHQRVTASKELLGAYQVFASDPNSTFSLGDGEKWKILAELAKGFDYENPEDLIGGMDAAMQKSQEAMQMKQQQQQAQSQQSQAAMQQAQTQAQAVQQEAALKEADQTHRHGLEVAESEAKTREMFVQAERNLAETKKALTDIEKIKAETEKILNEAKEVGKGGDSE